MFHTKILRRTVKEEVEVFMKEVIDKIRSKYGDPYIVCVMDNHASHRSKVMKAFFERERVEPMFMPPYSSPLNPIEHTWWACKAEWASQMARIKKVYDKNKFSTDLDIIVKQVFEKFTYRIMHGSDRAYDLVLKRQLV